MNDLVPRLLSGRNRISRLEKERVLQQVLSQVAAAETEKVATRRRNRWLWPGLLALASTTAGLALLWRVQQWPSRDGELWTRRGGPVAPGQSQLQTVCSDGQKEVACAPGRRLLLGLSFAPERPFFAAYAVRPDGAVLWYVPAAATQASVDLRAWLRRGYLAESLLLGDEHLPGRYRLYAIFSPQPLERQSLKDLVARRDRADVEIQTHELVITAGEP